MSIEAMKMALEALEEMDSEDAELNQEWLGKKAIAALRAAIEQAGEPYIAVNNDRITIDPVTGNVSIGIPAAPRQEQYDQTALELCEECGWKAIIPSDGCLVCARQKAKPVAYVDSRIHGWPDCFVMEPDPPHTVPLYTEPREWVGLTDEEYQIIHSKNYNYEELALAVEAKLKEKNA